MSEVLNQPQQGPSSQERQVESFRLQNVVLRIHCESLQCGRPHGIKKQGRMLHFYPMLGANTCRNRVEECPTPGLACLAAGQCCGLVFLLLNIGSSNESVSYAHLRSCFSSLIQSLGVQVARSRLSRRCHDAPHSRVSHLRRGSPANLSSPGSAITGTAIAVGWLSRWWQSMVGGGGLHMWPILE